MALIDCSECGHQVSDLAGSCPNCGAPVVKPPPPPPEVVPLTSGQKQMQVAGGPIMVVSILVGVYGLTRVADRDYLLGILLVVAAGVGFTVGQTWRSRQPVEISVDDGDRPTAGPVATTMPPGYQYPEPSSATTSVVLGVLGLILCGVLAPFAWETANTEIEAINEGRRSPANLGTANTGKVLGIVGSVFLGIALVVLLVAIIGVMLSEPLQIGDRPPR